MPAKVLIRKMGC